MNKSRILIVEDDEGLRSILCSRLKEFGQVEGVGSAEDALLLLRSSAFDLIVCDVGLPAMDGYKFCAALRAQKETAKIPVMILTGHSSIEDRLLGSSLGVCDFLAKPIDARELKTRIEIQLKRAKEARLPTAS